MASPAASVSLQLDTSYAQIGRMALPIAAAMLVPQVNFVTNNIFLGELSETALAVAGITGVYYLIFAVIGHGLNNGLQALISRRAGENNVQAIGQLFNQSVWIALAIAACSIAISYTLGPWLLRLAMHDDQMYHMAVSFLKVRIWGLPFLFLYQLRNALLVGTNNSRLLVVGTLAETLSNIFFDYTLIKGRLGFPALGFNGAAYASILAEAIGMAVVFAVVHGKGIGRKFHLFTRMQPHQPTIRLVLTQSSPLILQFAISIISWEIFYLMIEHYGTRDLAVSNTMRNVFGVFGCCSWAFAATANTMISNIIGQGKTSQVMPLLYRITGMSLAVAVCLVTVLNIFPGVFLSLFGQNTSFIAYATPVLRVVSLAIIWMSMGTVWLNAVTGTGNTKVNLAIEVAAVALYMIYIWLVLGKWKLSLTWAWGSEWVYWVSTLLLSAFYLFSGRWKNTRI